ncbi:excisionase family DNA-binding protein [Salmonirosea aquatica]|uniref:Helix-turn-helix domain-containing protein n=1 Tax=Salmonirosea aquatica TaxID=2654236 RepID=A0A7C9FCC9_9BACT|nr:helix-turn-helix domain-containing protein [Cytophagaceae bacterium SJW1-29]
MNALVGKPSRKDQNIARESLHRIQTATRVGKSGSLVIQIQEGSKAFEIVIPDKAVELLAAILANMAEGKATSVVTTDAELSTQQAADLLGVSRPHVIKMLEKGIIPFKKVGSHRRLLLEDLLKYQADLKKKRNEKLEFLAQQAQELGLGY